MMMLSLNACDILGEYRRGHQDCLGKSPAGGLYSDYTLVQNHHDNRGHVLKKNNQKCLGHGPLGPNSIDSCPNSSRRVRCRTSTGLGRGNNWLAKNGYD